MAYDQNSAGGGFPPTYNAATGGPDETKQGVPGSHPAPVCPGVGYPPQGAVSYSAPYPPAQGIQPGYPPGPLPQGIQAGPNQQVVVINQPMPINQFQECSVRTICPSCQQEMNTTLTHKRGVTAWLFCCMMAMMGCLLGCCLIPLFIDTCQDIVHTCPNCGSTVGRYNKMMGNGQHHHRTRCTY